MCVCVMCVHLNRQAIFHFHDLQMRIARRLCTDLRNRIATSNVTECAECDLDAPFLQKLVLFECSEAISTPTKNFGIMIMMVVLARKCRTSSSILVEIE